MTINSQILYSFLLSNTLWWIKMLWCILKADNMINYWTTWLFQSKRNSSAYSSKNDKMYCGLKSVVHNGISKLLLLKRYFIYGSNIGSETWSHFSLPQMHLFRLLLLLLPSSFLLSSFRAYCSHPIRLFSHVQIKYDR